MGTRDRVVDGGSREVVNGEGLGRRIADGVPGEHFAVRKQSDVNANDGPVDDRPPLSDLSGIRGDFGGSGLRRPAGQEPRLPVELPLERSAVDDGVLGLMPRRGVDVVREHGSRGTERQCVRQSHDDRGTQGPASSKNGRRFHHSEHPTAPVPVQEQGGKSIPLGGKPPRYPPDAFPSGRDWDRTSDLPRVKRALSR